MRGEAALYFNPRFVFIPAELKANDLRIQVCPLPLPNLDNDFVALAEILNKIIADGAGQGSKSLPPLPYLCVDLP